MLKKGKGKRYARKTKQGGVVTVNREHYVRDDIWSGLVPRSAVGSLRPEQPVLEHGLLLCPDTNVALHQVTRPPHPPGAMAKCAAPFFKA